MALEAVIFDWGGTLTEWHDIDFHAEAVSLAAAVSEVGHDRGASAAALRRAGEVVWGRSRDHQQSATVDDLFAEAGLTHDPAALAAYQEFWEPHTFTSSEVRPMWQELRTRGLRIGVLSNTIWPRAWHERIFRRDGVYDLVDGDVYTSEIAHTKPAGEAFAAAMDAVGVTRPEACVYVGDRLFDDVWGAQQAGMRAVHVPHSTIPTAQLGHTEGTPDGVLGRLSDLPELISTW